MATVLTRAVPGSYGGREHRAAEVGGHRLVEVVVVLLMVVDKATGELPSSGFGFADRVGSGGTALSWWGAAIVGVLENELGVVEPIIEALLGLD